MLFNTEGDIEIQEMKWRKFLKKKAKEKMENSNILHENYSLVSFGGIRDNNMMVLKTGFLNLKEAANARKVSGDIIVHSNSRKVVENKSWLWDWELADLNSYAHKKILDQIEGFKIRR